MYIHSMFNYQRRVSQQIRIGNLTLGGNAPVRIQSMANTDTNCVDDSVEQANRMILAGAEMVRFTTQGVLHVKQLAEIKKQLGRQGLHTPLVADVHFNSKVAFEATKVADKVRINPGNFVSSTTAHYSDRAFANEVEVIRQKLLSLIGLCRQHSTVLRIGVNHGSLSQRIMSRFGDTPEGLVASCMEFLSICRTVDFNDIVLSIKASNTLVMVQSVRLLIQKMRDVDMHYPLHLGVTEAGNGEDGRIKSAVGIGALLADGIGDTIRVSLSEDPEREMPVAKTLVDYIEQRANHPLINCFPADTFSPYTYHRRTTHLIDCVGGGKPPVVIAEEDDVFSDPYPDYFKQTLPFPILNLCYSDLTDTLISKLKEDRKSVIVLRSKHQNPVGEMRAFFHCLLRENITVPVIIARNYNENHLEGLQIKAGADVGALLLDGFGDGLWLTNTNPRITTGQVNSVAFSVLQAARVRMSRTEYIACPSCGRTLFDLQTTLAKVQVATAHLNNLKIAVMGCIVNGPGEMADADYGYVGAGRNRVSLYKGNVCIEKNIPEEQAIERLMELINNDLPKSKQSSTH
ncbi:MAG: (E)-4-hydroxy-3-methylbut-2-enyl-diphosphate synthase [Prevotellaceae bacterium]|jgi:(E)-4-hydroxy-3-methylbut-2-enyl-diphosphate synthase|nr:(E)-4-hydroxy-3-methylbut-2-enyl-diphosphate synthase [Prevotellaceae bacterium]